MLVVLDVSGGGVVVVVDVGSGGAGVVVVEVVVDVVVVVVPFTHSSKAAGSVFSRSTRACILASKIVEHCSSSINLNILSN